MTASPNKHRFGSENHWASAEKPLDINADESLKDPGMLWSADEVIGKKATLSNGDTCAECL